MAWLVWLAIPVVATLVASVLSWLRNRPLPSPGTDEAMHAHREYLAAFDHAPRAHDRGPVGRSGS